MRGEVIYIAASPPRSITPNIPRLNPCRSATLSFSDMAARPKTLDRTYLLVHRAVSSDPRVCVNVMKATATAVFGFFFCSEFVKLRRLAKTIS